MSRFKDLSQTLRAQAENKAAAEEDLKRALEASRDGHIPLIARTLAVIKDFYDEILQPDLELVPIDQIHEYSGPESTKYPFNAPYTYIVNLVPPAGRRPYPDDPFDMEYTKKGIFRGYGAWHPNVAFQAEIDLKQPYDYQAKVYTTDLRPEVCLKVWGLPPPTNSEAPAEEALRISTGDGGWSKTATYTWLNPQKTRSLEHYEQLLVGALTLVAPNILHHYDIVRGAVQR